MNEKYATAVSINKNYCSGCSICQSICPFEAIKQAAEPSKYEIDLNKCQVCGICYSACPAFAVDIFQYDYNILIEYVKRQMKERSSETLVLMCRGNSPETSEAEEILKEQNIKTTSYIPLRLPCAGRVPPEFLFKAVQVGIKEIISIQCEDAFCRFKEGSKTNTRRLVLSKTILQQMGLPKNILKIIKYSNKAFYDRQTCVGCDKCVFICPYDAIEAQEFATPRILEEKCMGCGACALVCPHNAIQVKGYEFKETLMKYLYAAKTLKARGNHPLILVFVCQWSTFEALNKPQSHLKKNVFLMEVPCSKALDPVHILNAFENGFDGIAAVTCSSEDCKLQKGKETTERNLALLKNVLKKKDLSNRFALINLSPRDDACFSKRLDEFIGKITELPRLEKKVLEAKTHV